MDMFMQIRTRLALVIAPWLAPAEPNYVRTPVDTATFYYVNSATGTTGTTYTVWGAN